MVPAKGIPFFSQNSWMALVYSGLTSHLLTQTASFVWKVSAGLHQPLQIAEPGAAGLSHHQDQVHAADGGDHRTSDARGAVHDGQICFRRMLQHSHFYLCHQLSGISAAHFQNGSGKYAAVRVKLLSSGCVGSQADGIPGTYMGADPAALAAYSLME